MHNNSNNNSKNIRIPVLKSRWMTYIFLTSINTATDTVERNTCKNARDFH